MPHRDLYMFYVTVCVLRILSELLLNYSVVSKPGKQSEESEVKIGPCNVNSDEVRGYCGM